MTIPLQWIIAALVPAETDVNLDAYPAMSWISETWPYTVPVGAWLGLRAFQIGSKFTHAGTASYLVIENVITVPDSLGLAVFPHPIRIPGGTTLHAHLINNAPNQQWMTSVVQGILHQP